MGKSKKEYDVGYSNDLAITHRLAIAPVALTADGKELSTSKAGCVMSIKLASSCYVRSINLSPVRSPSFGLLSVGSFPLGPNALPRLKDDCS